MKTVLKIATALAAIAGIVYAVATYGDQIVAWAKRLLNACPCKRQAEAENICNEEDIAEEAAEEAPVVEETAEEPQVAENEPVAEETDFEA